MSIPTRYDRAIAEIDDLHAAIVIKLRTWQHAGPRRDPAEIRRALQDYADRIVELINGHAQ